MSHTEAYGFSLEGFLALTRHARACARRPFSARGSLRAHLSWAREEGKLGTGPDLKQTSSLADKSHPVLPVSKKKQNRNPYL